MGRFQGWASNYVSMMIRSSGSNHVRWSSHPITLLNHLRVLESAARLNNNIPPQNTLAAPCLPASMLASLALHNLALSTSPPQIAPEALYSRVIASRLPSEPWILDCRDGNTETSPV